MSSNFRRWVDKADLEVPHEIQYPIAQKRSRCAPIGKSLESPLWDSSNQRLNMVWKVKETLACPSIDPGPDRQHSIGLSLRVKGIDVADIDKGLSCQL